MSEIFKSVVWNQYDQYRLNYYFRKTRSFGRWLRFLEWLQQTNHVNTWICESDIESDPKLKHRSRTLRRMIHQVPNFHLKIMTFVERPIYRLLELESRGRLHQARKLNQENDIIEWKGFVFFYSACFYIIPVLTRFDVLSYHCCQRKAQFHQTLDYH